MQIYVQSAGADRERDYRWARCDSGRLTVCEPPMVARGQEWASTDEQSVVLLRQGESLVLLVIIFGQPGEISTIAPFGTRSYGLEHLRMNPLCERLPLQTCVSGGGTGKKSRSVPWSARSMELSEA